MFRLQFFTEPVRWFGLFIEYAMHSTNDPGHKNIGNRLPEE